MLTVRAKVLVLHVTANHAEGTQVIKYDDERDPEGDESEEVDYISDLNVAYGRIKPPRTPPEIKVDKKEIYFPVVKIRIPLFREPEYVLLSSCIPLLLLNIISMCIYILDPVESFSDRLGSVITVLLALFAFLPTYREQIPVATITSLDVAIFVSIAVLFLVMMDSVIGTYEYITDGGHATIAIVSAALIFGITLYIGIRYVYYRVIKKELEKFEGGGSICSHEFNPVEWNCVCMRLPKQNLRRVLH